MVSFNLYSILGVNKECSKDDLKKAYKKLAIKYHPDKGGDENKFKEVSEAYQILSDDEKREMYNNVGDEGLQQGLSNNTVDPNDIFEQFFGGRGGFPFDIFGMNNMHNNHNQRKKCRNIHHVISITNKEAYFGMEKTVKIKLSKKCMTCISTCNQCQGSGQINKMQRMGPFTTIATASCNKCSGSGKSFINNISCKKCNGKIDIQEEKIIKIEIPIGVETGNKIIIGECGEQPQTPNDIPGDLIFEILVKIDNNFERKGLDLIFKESISFKESIIGKNIIIPLYNEELNIDTSSFGIIQPNKEYIIENKGMKSLNKIGNLIILFEIKYPDKKLDKNIKDEFDNIFKKYF